MSDQIGITRKHRFTLIPDSIIDDERISGNAVLTYIAIARHADKERTCFPSVSTIAKKAHLARSTVQKGIDELEQFGYLEREHRKKGDTQEHASNVYTLVDFPDEARTGIPPHGTPTPQDGTPIPCSGNGGIPPNGNEGIGIPGKYIHEGGTGRNEDGSTVPAPEHVSEEESGREFLLLCAEITSLAQQKNSRFRIPSDQCEQLRGAFGLHGRRKLFDLFKEHEAKPRRSAIGDILFFLQDIRGMKPQKEVEQAEEKKAQSRTCEICGGQISGFSCASCGMDYVWNAGVREFNGSPFDHVKELYEGCEWARYLFTDNRIKPEYMRGLIPRQEAV